MRRVHLAFVLLASGCSIAVEPFASDAGSFGDGSLVASDATAPSDAAADRSDASGSGEDAAVAGRDGSAASADARAPGADASAPVPDGGSCTGLPLAQRVKLTSIDVTPDQVSGGWYQPDVVLSPLPDGTSKVAWSSGDTVHVTRLDGNDQRAAADLTFASSDIAGFAARPVGGALLLVQGEVMVLLGFDDAGAQTFKVTFTNNNPVDQPGATWIDSWSRAGRLASSDTDYAAYFGITKFWDATVGRHQGDYLSQVDDAGHESNVWDWGCSHSLDVRIAWNGDRYGPVCLSDCYPIKAIMFDHTESEISDEPSGNCSGGSNAQLGGLAPMSDGFYVTFTSPEGRASSDVAFSRVSNDGKAGPKVYLTNTPDVQESGAKLARYGTNLLAAWLAGADRVAAVVDTSGNILEGPVALTGVSFNDHDDFVTFANGEVGWAWGEGATLNIARVRLCQ
jgi:hypothetical protein